MILLIYHLSPLFFPEQIFFSDFNVTSEYFKIGILMFHAYVLYYFYGFPFLHLFFPVLIFTIYRELTWHVYLI